jgi:hypothetical protein
MAMADHLAWPVLVRSGAMQQRDHARRHSEMISPSLSGPESGKKMIRVCLAAA